MFVILEIHFNNTIGIAMTCIPDIWLFSGIEYFSRVTTIPISVLECEQFQNSLLAGRPFDSYCNAIDRQVIGEIVFYTIKSKTSRNSFEYTILYCLRITVRPFTLLAIAEFSGRYNNEARVFDRYRRLKFHSANIEIMFENNFRRILSLSLSV